MYDVYLKRDETILRIATPAGAGLPAHVIASEWELLPAGISPVSDTVERDIEAVGFSYFSLPGPEEDANEGLRPEVLNAANDG